MTKRLCWQTGQVLGLVRDIQKQLYCLHRLPAPADAALRLAQAETGLERVLDGLREAREELAALADGRGISERLGRGREVGDMLGLARAG